MEKFIDFMERTLVPVATKVGNNKYLVAIRDAFIGMLAITMVGSFASLINGFGTVPGFKWFAAMMKGIFGPNWTKLNGMIWFGTLACMSIFLVFALSNRLAKNLGDDGFEAMLVAAACYFTLLPQNRVLSVIPEGAKDPVNTTVEGYIAWGPSFNGTALFTAMIIAIFATLLFVNLSRVKFLIIKLPDGVPPAVSRAFAKLLPGMLTIFVFALLGLLFGLLMSPDGTYAAFDKTNSFNQQILKWLTPVINGADSLPVAILIVFLIHLFWFFGLHGGNLLTGITTPILTALASQNDELYKQGVAISSGKYAIMAGPFFDTFVFVGGAGATLGLLIALLIFAKKKRQIVAISLPPGIFEINEPVLFGLPLVLNVSYVIPLILTPVVLTIVTYLSMKWGIVHPVVAVSVPWATPVGINGYMATGGHISGLILSIVNLAISVAIYSPFVIVAERIEARQLAEAGNENGLDM